ncbi:MAG: hypothetical protein JXA99_08755 [Candidatus Lokiarchaeota archaeon]|nr:hypothetical protein [Candidatus Lokiarchaeota archaeon]
MNTNKKKEFDFYDTTLKNIKNSLISFNLTEIISIDSVEDSNDPIILIDNFENIHVTWIDKTNYSGCGNDFDVVYKQWNNLTKEWSLVEVISNDSIDNSYRPSMAIDSLGDIHIGWEDTGNLTGINDDYLKSDIYYKKMDFSTGQWSCVEHISINSTQSACNPSITTDSQNNIHLAWYDITDYDGEYDYDIFYRRWNYTSKLWTSIEVLSNESTGASQNQMLTNDEYDNIHLVWEDWTDYNGCGNDFDIFYRKWDNNTKEWSSIEVISNESTSGSYDPSVIVDNFDNIHVTWEDWTDYNGCGNDPDIFYKQWNNLTKEWSSLEVISNESNNNSQRQSLTADPLGNIYVSWQDNTNYDYSGDDYDIFYKIWNVTSETWSSMNLISTESTENSISVSLTTDNKGRIFVAWEDWTDYNGCGDDRDIFYKYIISNDKPIITSFTNNIFTNGSGLETINWTISDQIGGEGIYHILANDTENHIYEWISWSQWNSNITLSIPINRIAPETYIYTIEYYDKYHLKGLNSSVIVIINDSAPIVEGPNDHEVYRGTTYLLTWTIIDDFGWISYKIYNNGAAENWHLWPMTDPIPYLLDISNLGTYNITIAYNTTTSQNDFYTTLITVVRSPMEIFINDYLIYLIILIVVLIGISIYIIFNKNKKVKKVSVWKAKTEVLFETLNIDSLLIIHKETSTILLNKNYFKRIEEPSLIGGFLQAITSFKYVLKDQDIKATLHSKEMFLLDFREYKILIEDGEFIRIALIINLMPSDYIMNASTKFIEEFEARYYKYLTHFYGEVSIFEQSMDLIDKYFNIHLIHPHMINPNPPSHPLTNFQERVLNYTKEFYSSNGHFHVTHLLEFLIVKIPQEPRDKIIATISDLINYGYIKPVRLSP